MESANAASGPANPSTYWRKCTTCKKPIGFAKKYWVCSVSTCNRQRTGLVFCDIRCFDAHVPVLNHRDAGAFERQAPTQTEAAAPRAALHSKSAGAQVTSADDEVLVVVSKVKAYIRAKSGMNTSESVMDTLSEFVRRYADRAIESAERNGRKTVLDRDF